MYTQPAQNPRTSRGVACDVGLQPLKERLRRLPSPRRSASGNGPSQFLLLKMARRERMFFFWETSLAAPRGREKGKGCDIGYALGISSCEEANSVETCTVSPLCVD